MDIDLINSVPTVMESVTAQFACSLAKGIDQIIREAMETAGYPIDETYIREHMAIQETGSPFVKRIWHDGALFLEIRTNIDSSDPMKLKATQTATLYS